MTCVRIADALQQQSRVVEALSQGDPGGNDSSQQHDRINGEDFGLESPTEGFLRGKGRLEAIGGASGRGVRRGWRPLSGGSTWRLRVPREWPVAGGVAGAWR